MKRTVFYSWQSDSPSATNRNLIEDALSRAVRAIQRDDAATVEPVVDRDTGGIPGAPAIADSIYAKIAEADVLVADVTIANPAAPERWTPNPNVLVELGYAVPVLGWERIILVQNTTFGGPERLRLIYGDAVSLPTISPKAPPPEYARRRCSHTHWSNVGEAS